MKLKVLKHYNDYDVYSFISVQISTENLLPGGEYLEVVKAANIRGDFVFHVFELLGNRNSRKEICSLSDLREFSEEKLFQESLVKKCSLSMELICAMQKIGTSFIHDNGRYSYNVHYEIEIGDVQ